MKNFHVLLITVVLTIVAFFIVLPVASGAERRIPGLSCAAAQTSAIFRDLGYPSYFRGTVSPSFSLTNILECPIMENSVFPKWAVNFLNVHGHLMTNGRVMARGCSVQSGNTPITFCGRENSFTGVGNFVLRFNAVDLDAAWGPEHSTDYGFVQIRFSSGGGFITGIFLGN